MLRALGTAKNTTLRDDALRRGVGRVLTRQPQQNPLSSSRKSLSPKVVIGDLVRDIKMCLPAHCRTKVRPTWKTEKNKKSRHPRMFLSGISKLWVVAVLKQRGLFLIHKQHKSGRFPITASGMTPILYKNPFFVGKMPFSRRESMP